MAELRNDSLRRVEAVQDSLRRVQAEFLKDSLRQEKIRRREEKKARNRKEEEEHVKPESNESLSMFMQPLIDDRIWVVRMNNRKGRICFG